MKNPVIGITLDAENNQNYSMYPWYASRKNYSDSVVLAGGTPVFLPHNLNMIEKFIEKNEGEEKKTSKQDEKKIKPKLTKPEKKNLNKK